MTLTPQQQKVVDFLQDGKWHCMANDFWMKDDRKRISELNQMGFTIIGMKCDGYCKIKHSSRVYMRKLKGYPEGYQSPKTGSSDEFVLEGLQSVIDPWTGLPTGEYREIYATTEYQA